VQLVGAVKHFHVDITFLHAAICSTDRFMQGGRWGWIRGNGVEILLGGLGFRIRPAMRFSSSQHAGLKWLLSWLERTPQMWNLRGAVEAAYSMFSPTSPQSSGGLSDVGGANPPLAQGLIVAQPINRKSLKGPGD